MAPKRPSIDPVGERHGDGHGDAGERAAAAHGERKGNRQHRHDDGDERIGELVPELHPQAHGVKSALAQVADVAVELAEVHLLRLQVFLLEVAGLFVNFGERGVFELADIGSAFAPSKIALPAILEDPCAGVGVPKDARGEDAPREREGGGVEFEDGEVGEFVAVRIEELVVEDAAGLARYAAGRRSSSARDAERFAAGGP